MLCQIPFLPQIARVGRQTRRTSQMNIYDRGDLKSKSRLASHALTLLGVRPSDDLAKEDDCRDQCD